LVLLRVGFAMPWALLRRRCALTAPFHPYRNSRTSQALRACACLAFASGSKADWLAPFTYVRRYIFCGTFRRAASAPRQNAPPKHPPGRYPAHCSMEFGLSSLPAAQPGKSRRSQPEQRPSGL